MNVAVIGAGTMGSGIAQACAVAGHDVELCDVAPGALERAEQGIAHSLGRLVRKEALSQAEADEARGRIAMKDRLEGLGEAGVVIEAVYESIEVKRDVWRRLAEVTSEGALLATNTSSLSVTEVAGFSGRPERFCGLHFFNPVPMMALVEVVRGLQSSDETVEQARAFAEGIGKTPIVCESALRRRGLGRGHRPGHEARRQHADRAAGAVRPGRPRRLPGRKRRHLPRVR
ncbi:MAG: 3-hydroxyacyl-CoA dehydrogenase NAD-binding domain-containing protein [Deinococcales bacterium]